MPEFCYGIPSPMEGMTMDRRFTITVFDRYSKESHSYTAWAEHRFEMLERAENNLAHGEIIEAIEESPDSIEFEK